MWMTVLLMAGSLLLALVLGWMAGITHAHHIESQHVLHPDNE